MKNSGIDPKTCLPDEAKFEAFMLQYRQQIMLYESAIQCVTMRLDLIEKECEAQRMRKPIRSVSSRIKTLGSINRKLKTKGLPLTMESMIGLNDVAGIRVICEYIHDVYAVRDALLSAVCLNFYRKRIISKIRSQTVIAAFT